MRKLFLLLPALVLSLFANAAVININTGTTDALRKALNSATDGDEIVMAAGTYVESNSNYIAFTGKNITVRAAEGAEVILQPQVMVRLKEGATARFEGIKFDCSRLNELGSYSNVFVAADANDANNFAFENCEFYNFTVNSSLIYCSSSNKLASVSINNCYFHNIMKSCLFVDNTADINVQIKNSTFANISTDAGSYSAAPIDVRATNADFLVDHCTFYNVLAMNTDYAAVGKSTITNGVVSNSIFMLPESQDNIRAIRGVKEANNCLTFNYLKDSGKGIHSDVAKNNCIFANPLFADAANGNFSLAGNWVSMNISPARGAATDGSDLGDPRWYTAETLPSTNFASPYPFVGAKALITGNIWYDGTNDYLYYNDKSECGTATWKINATRACALQATLNMNAGTSTDHQFKVEVLDADGNSIAQTREPSSTSAGENIELPDPLSIPAAGNYTIKLYNLKSWSSAKINSITLAYKGGAIQNLPCELALEDAIHSALVFVNGEGEMQFSDETDPQGSQVSAQYAKWNMNVDKEGFYKFATHVKSDNGQSYTVNIYNSDETILKGTASLPEEGNYGYERTFATDLIYLEASNYVLKIQNNTNYSHGRVIDIKATYEGGALVNLPNAAIPFEDAILNGATRDGDGIHFGAVDRYAEWNVAATAGLYTFTFDVVGSNYGHYQLTIIDSESNTIYDNYKGQSASGSVTHSSIYLDGNYTIRVANTNPGADGYITSIAATAASDIFVLDENTTEDGSVAAKDGAHWKLMLRRTFSAGKYYSICIPIDSYDSELTNIFGTGYELWAMESAIQNGEEISLNFTQITDGSFVAGKPYLIKPTQNVENPTFSSHTIHNSTYNNVQSFAAADFIGSFYKTVIPAGESNLYLQNNNLYYSETNNTPIKGTRAWIQLKQSGSLAPARARIVLLNQVVTNIQLAEPEENKAIKTIENGQLIIIRDGVRYNAMGIIMK